MVAAPVITSFTASPGTIAYGLSSQLAWTTSNAASVTIDQGVGAQPLNGNTTVSPTATTIYTLTATNAVNVSVTQTVTVTVQPPVGFAIDSITAVPNPVLSSTTVVTVTAHDDNGGTLSYNWSATGPGTVTIIQPGQSQSVAAFPAAGTYVLSATVYSSSYPGYPLTASVSVIVVQTISSVRVTPPVVTISVDQSANFQAEVLATTGHQGHLAVKYPRHHGNRRRDLGWRRLLAFS